MGAALRRGVESIIISPPVRPHLSYFPLLFVLLLPGCLTRLLWEPDRPSDRTIVRKAPLNPTFLHFDSFPGPGFPDEWYLSFDNRLPTTVPIVLDNRLDKGSGVFRLLKVDPFVAVRGADGNEVFFSSFDLNEETMPGPRANWRLVVVNRDVRRLENPKVTPGEWDGRLTVVIDDGEGNETYIQDYRVWLVSEAPESFGSRSPEGKVLLSYWESTTLPKYEPAGIVRRVFLTPFALAIDISAGLLWIIFLDAIGLDDDEEGQ